MLQAPSYVKLSRRATIFLCQLDDSRVLHPKGPRKWRISFNDDVVLLTMGGEFRPSVEGVNFYLVHSRLEPWVTGEELVNLKPQS